MLNVTVLYVYPAEWRGGGVGRKGVLLLVMMMMALHFPLSPAVVVVLYR